MHGTYDFSNLLSANSLIIVRPLLKKIDKPIDYFSGDGAYEETPVYAVVIEHSPNAEVVIPPRANAVGSDKSAPQRNRTLIEIAGKVECNGKKIGSMVGEITQS